MNIEEAEKILRACGGSVRIDGAHSVSLNGWFSVDQLEAVLTLMRTSAARERRAPADQRVTDSQ